jgi:hypothetical protein
MSPQHTGARKSTHEDRVVRDRHRRPAVAGLGEHSFTLTAAGDGTRLVQSETLRGLLVPLSGKTIAAAEADFAALNRALKQRVEEHN